MIKINAKKIFLIICVLIVVFILVGTYYLKNRSPYYIHPPKESHFNLERVSALSNEDISRIKEFIPSVTKWYNSIDITQTYVLDDFLPDDVQSVGRDIFENESFQHEINGLPFNQEELDQAIDAVLVYGGISSVIVNSELHMNLFSDEPTSITIDKGEWESLQEDIIAAIDYYYN